MDNREINTRAAVDFKRLAFRQFMITSLLDNTDIDRLPGQKHPKKPAGKTIKLKNRMESKGGALVSWNFSTGLNDFTDRNGRMY
jgi:hypothetical protein